MNRIVVWLVWGIAVGSIGTCLLIVNHLYIFGLLCIPAGMLGSMLAYAGYQIYQKGKKKC